MSLLCKTPCARPCPEYLIASSSSAPLIDPTWIAQALGIQRQGLHPPTQAAAEHAVWLVLGLALFRDRPLWRVVQQLDLSLDGQAPPAPVVSCATRQRLGEEPLAELFALLTQAWSRPR